MRRTLVMIFLLGTMLPIFGQHQVDVLIIGGGAGGTSAGIQAARMGAKVRILEKTTWLGGMLTSAGVSAIDGNHQLPSGIWGEFREKLYAHYGGPKAVATGWVSHTLFEPSVGNKILKEMTSIPNLDIVFNAVYQKIIKREDIWEVTYTQGRKTESIEASILIDATETGELLPLVDAEYRLGMDSKSETGEQEAPDEANNVVQDLTYVAILEDVGVVKHRKGLVKKPRNYSSEPYACACKREDGEMFGAVSGCEQMLNYGKLPNSKYMINWPNCGNDFFVNWPELSASERMEQFKKAKDFTQGFIYYIQNELGFKNLRLAEEFPTKDGYPMIPYHREGRRVKGKTFLVVDHLERPYDFGLYKTGVTVGDYPIDHHHDKNPEAPEIDFINIKVPSYSIPMGSLVPRQVDNFLVADKNISVSNIVNGTTRLQPVVLGIGQAAGAIAGQAVLKQSKTSKVSIREVQRALLEQNAYLIPFMDVTPSDIGFGAIQRIGVSGVLKGYGVPYKWANQTWFYPERLVSEYELKTGLEPLYPKLDKLQASGAPVSSKFLIGMLQLLEREASFDTLKTICSSVGYRGAFSESTPLDRRMISILVDQLLNPFQFEVDYQGKLLEK
ncbi:FAD-dependent oxidoreductase [Flagellimonas flava]|uniref:FAD dependent oxidoreductase n=1 Tax=Flagellimonas flava TaxID=570519 RepID=A0A1M5NRE5_9FLAO|nr:FAD-dependent oxidoreductase [Allomuricauda flava]SHG92015.1 FAD dependent oxidoreductase [Allomuricauda flava]